MIPLFDLKRQTAALQDDITCASNEVLLSGQYILGEKVAQFESMAASYLGCDYAVGVANGTDALIIALDALGVKAGDEVIAPAFTFWGTIEAILRLGAKPVLVDIEPVSLCLDPVETQKAITQKTRAIITVDLYGLRANIGKLYDISRTYNIPVIEDAAQAFSSKWQTTSPGEYVEAACFSFFPTKPLGCAGDGGMVVTNNKDLADRVKMLRSHGWVKKYQPEITGYNSRLDALQAAILIEKMLWVNTWGEFRRTIAEHYLERLTPLTSTGHLKLPEAVDGHAWHLFTMQVMDRDKVIERLAASGVECGVYYPVPIHHTKVGAKFCKSVFPVAEQAAKQVLSIPCFAEMLPGEVEWVVEKVIACL